jgi:hypothetical protein
MFGSFLALFDLSTEKIKGCYKFASFHLGLPPTNIIRQQRILNYNVKKVAAMQNLKVG